MFELLVEQHLFQKAVEYVDGTIDLRELEEWLLPNLETILDGGNDYSIALAEILEGGAIELQAGISSEETLVQELKKLLSSPKFNQDFRWASNTAERKEIWDMKVIDDAEDIEDTELVEDVVVSDQPQNFGLELQFK